MSLWRHCWLMIEEEEEEELFIRHKKKHSELAYSYKVKRVSWRPLMVKLWTERKGPPPIDYYIAQTHTESPPHSVLYTFIIYMSFIEHLKLYVKWLPAEKA